MESKKSVLLSPKKNGNGYITSYSVNIGCAEAKLCGFVSEDGTPKRLIKTINSKNGSIIFTLDQDGAD